MEVSIMAYSASPEFQSLYHAFTGSPDSIGAHLNSHMGKLSSSDPLLVVTGSDVVLFPGHRAEPVAQSFRNSQRGFVELTGVSHLGVAVPYLVRLKELGFEGWKQDACRLIERTKRVRSVNAVAYWRDVVAVEAWAGREERIADLVDYSCDVTLDYLERAMEDPSRLTFPYLRNHFLDPIDSGDVPVPMNDMMAATFALVFLDSGYRILGWLRRQEIDWSRLMIILSGRSGRLTAGLSWQSNSMCHLLWQASGRRLAPERVYICPLAPGVALADLKSPEVRDGIEAEFRKIWFSTRATVEMGRAMYAGYPAFEPAIDAYPVVDATTRKLSDLPVVRSLGDRRSIITLLRYVMEDPRQQLANASAQFIIDQLADNGNRPQDVIVPGFSNTVYPRRNR
jgi:Domain of unknown function (DUF5624)